MTGVLNRPLRRIVKPNTTPAAGGVFSFIPNKDGGWLFKSLRFLFTTDANAATRQVFLQALRGDDVYMQVPANNSQIASRADVYSWIPGTSGGPLITGMLSIDCPTDGLYLPRGHVLQAAVSNIQVGDTFSLVVASVIEYPDGPDRELWPYGPGVFSPQDMD